MKHFAIITSILAAVMISTAGAAAYYNPSYDAEKVNTILTPMPGNRSGISQIVWNSKWYLSYITLDSVEYRFKWIPYSSLEYDEHTGFSYAFAGHIENDGRNYAVRINVFQDGNIRLLLAGLDKLIDVMYLTPDKNWKEVPGTDVFTSDDQDSWEWFVPAVYITGNLKIIDKDRKSVLYEMEAVRLKDWNRNTLLDNDKLHFCYYKDGVLVKKYDVNFPEDTAIKDGGFMMHIYTVPNVNIPDEFDQLKIQYKDEVDMLVVDLTPDDIKSFRKRGKSGGVTEYEFKLVPAETIRSYIESIPGASPADDTPATAHDNQTDTAYGELLPAPEYNCSPEVTRIEAAGVTFEMIYVAPGSFMFRDTYHAITDKGFHIGRTEVTQELWSAVMGYNNSYEKGEDLPVNMITYTQALEFCSRLSRLTGRKFRLPTEIEWEYAAKGGKSDMPYLYAGSDDPLEVGWFLENSGKQFGAVNPVGKKKPNSLGIFDMSGNVSEMCSDYVDTSHPEHEQLPGADRRVRGGGCACGGNDRPSIGGSSYNSIYDTFQQGFGLRYVGLRVVME